MTREPSGQIANGRRRYFPTVYEPTVFENYVHGAYDPIALAKRSGSARGREGGRKRRGLRFFAGSI